MKELLEKLAAINAKRAAILKADALTPEQRAEVDSLKQQATDLKARIAEQKELDADATELVTLQAAETKAANDREIAQRAANINPRKTNAAGSAEVASLTPVRDASIAGNWGFSSFGEFAREVAHSVTNQRQPTRILNGFDQARQMATATGMGEAIGSDGGHLVPQEFANRIFERVYSPDGLIGRTDIYNVGSNSITLPRVSESSRVTGSRTGGVQAYWRGEGAAPTATKPVFGQLKLTLHKLIAMGVATDELIEDSATALDQFLFGCFSREINFLIGDSLVNGTGAGQPMGILNADCTVSVTKETGQSAATVNATNLLKMYARLWAGCRPNAVWLINQDIEPQLLSLQMGTGVANAVVYMPPGGLSQLPYATLLGKPVLPVEFCATLGTVGDIILVDLSQWVTAVKSGGPKTAVSMHLYFDREEQAFRVSYRIDSQPWWASAITPYKGTNTLGCAVTLATRA